ncbi:MAG TPA: hypothetical protein VF535_14345 [Allosphingosinicella sp.]|jgi:hypothetical protein
MAEGRRRRPRRLLEAAFVAAVGAGAVWAARGFRHDRQLAGRFDQVRLGLDRPGVEAVLGAPGWEGGCTAYVGYLPRANCDKELGYASAFAPLRPAHYMIQLDRGGKVIEAEPVRSR